MNGDEQMCVIFVKKLLAVNVSERSGRQQQQR